MSKTYVCSNIHGRYDRYKKLFEIVKPEDTLYILGDVIDRHDEGIQILQDMMKRKNVHLFIGNHEHMMYQAVMNTNISKKDQKYFQEIWDYDCNKVTKKVWESLSDSEKQAIKEYLEQAYLFKRITIHDKSIYLSHAGSKYRYDEIEEMRLLDMDYKESFDFVWDTIFNRYTNDIDPHQVSNYNKDHLYIFGHTMVQRIRENCFEHCYSEPPFEVTSFKINNHELIYIDGGCANDTHIDKFTRLNLICLDDLSEYYIS